MNKVKYIVLGLLLLPSVCITAQERNFEEEFNEFKKQQKENYEEFQTKVDEEFADFLKQAWEHFTTARPIPRPERPEPFDPVSFLNTEKRLPNVEIKPSNILPAEIPTEVSPVSLPPFSGEESSKLKISFYGSSLQIAGGFARDLRLTSITEKDIADAWSKLCKNDYQSTIRDCLSARDKLQLNDWGYVELIKRMATCLFADGQENERTFFQMFVLSQSGFKARIAKVDNKLSLMLATRSMIYGVPFVNIEGVNYYICDPLSSQASKGVFTYRKEFPNAKNLIDLNIKETPNFRKEEYTEQLVSEAYPNMKVESKTNTHLIDFYNDYPPCDVAIYAKAPMSKELEASVLPVLRKQLEGKSQKEAVNRLLNFVQTAFKYKTDGEQFGYEKPFFIDELFFYPYCDCEDRAIFFSFLVKKLLGLDAVLLDYPNHIASAVCFDEEVSGDFLTIEGKKFLIGDPTYIGAPIGCCMPQFRNQAPKVIR